MADAATEGSDAATAAKLLVVSMVKRAMASADGAAPNVSMLTEVAGVYNHSVAYRNPDGNLYLYASELRDLQAIVSGEPRGAVSYRSTGL